MKLSKLTYHNGAIKIEVYQKGQDRKRWNTGIRVDKKLLNKDRFIKTNAQEDWQELNIKISEEKERVDKAMREVFKQQKYIDVLKVFDILNQQKKEIEAGIKDKLSRVQIKNGNVRRRLTGAIKDLHQTMQSNKVKRGIVANYRSGEAQREEHLANLELSKRERFLSDLRHYINREGSVTSQTTVARYFLEYLSDGTTIGFNNLKRHYRIFEFMINNPILIEDINDSWVRNLSAWLKNGVRGNKINSNTRAWYFNRFQCFWTWALNANAVNKRIEWKRFPIPTFKPGFVFLNEERFIQLYNTKFSDHRLEYTRIAYLIIALTGLRHSDFHKLRSHHVIKENGAWFIHMANKKTKTVFKVHVHNIILDWVRSEEILKKIKLSIDSTRSDHLLNENIREIGEILEWKEPIRMQVDAEEWETKPFYEWMNCHSGRHSAVCNWLSNGAKEVTIKKWMGYKGSKMVDYYTDFLNIDTKQSVNDLIKFK